MVVALGVGFVFVGGSVQAADVGLLRWLRGDANVAKAVLDAVGAPRGVCVFLGDKECVRALELARTRELLIYVQLESDESVEAARRAADEAGFYGTRVYVEKGGRKKIHLADNGPGKLSYRS